MMNNIKTYKAVLLFCTLIFLSYKICCQEKYSYDGSGKVLSAYIYHQNFEINGLGGWCSYPHWQDLAYDPNFMNSNIIPNDANRSLVAKSTPYSNVDNYVGAEKLLDMYVSKKSILKFKYYIKSNQNVSWLSVRMGTARNGTLEKKIYNNKLNCWNSIEINISELLPAQPQNDGNKYFKINALAILAKTPDADPDMPIFLGIDDVMLSGKTDEPFKFIENNLCYKLPEFSEFIFREPIKRGSSLKFSGTWDSSITSVKFTISAFTDSSHTLIEKSLEKSAGRWKLEIPSLSLSPGIYYGKIQGYNLSRKVSQTISLFHVSAPQGLQDTHPRLLFDRNQEKHLQNILLYNNIPIRDSLISKAASDRKNYTIETLVYDLDQFPKDNWLPTWDAFGKHLYVYGQAIESNALSYALTGDTAAFNYNLQILTRICKWPSWNHPWQIKRYRYSDHREGTFSRSIAIAYDLMYDKLTPATKELIQHSIIEKIIKNVFQTYVFDNNIAYPSSNWISATVGNALLNIASVYDDLHNDSLEVYLLGSLIKFDRFIRTDADTTDGSWGEGLGYHDYSLANMGYSIPAIKNVFNTDLSPLLKNTFKEYVWGGIFSKQKWFEFGDSKIELSGTANNWAFLVGMSKNPELAWYYHQLKGDQRTLKDLIFSTDSIKEKNLYNESPSHLFKKQGTVVFKSGWGNNDFTFVLRSGPFYNHQHLDQGTFYLADSGKIFIQDKPLINSDYYADPIYQSDLTQPIAHSTIILNDNPQSQRTGDNPAYADGFNNYASVPFYITGDSLSYAAADIGKLYWDKALSITRNVLYIKPGLILLTDVIVPAVQDSALKVSELFQNPVLKNIISNNVESRIIDSPYILHITHLLPLEKQVTNEETPHYLYTLLKDRNLVKEGMLKVSAITEKQPLIMSNLMSINRDSSITNTHLEEKEGFFSGNLKGVYITINKKIADEYKVQNIQTDALCLAKNHNETIAAYCRRFSDDICNISSNKTICVNIKNNKYYVFAATDDTDIEYSYKLETSNGRNVKLKLLKGMNVLDK